MTELGLYTAVVPEQTVQEAPESGSSFFETLTKASETAEEAANVTDDKPEAEAGDEASETRTEEANHDEEVGQEAEKAEKEPEEYDVAAEMMALGRMFTVKVEESAAVTNEGQQPAAVEAAQPEGPAAQLFELPQAQGQAQAEIDLSGMAEAAAGEAVQAPEARKAPEAQPEGAAVTEGSFVESMQHSLEEALAAVEAAEPEQAQQPDAEAQTEESVSELEPGTGNVTAAESAESADLSQSFAGEDRDRPQEAQTEMSELSADDVKVHTPADIRAQQSPGAQQEVGQTGNAQLAQAIERAIERFAEDFRLAQVDVGEITIKLEPEELGSISITIQSENNLLTAKIVTDNREAASLLSAQIEQYLEAMGQKGVKVARAEVLYESQLDLSQRQQGESGRGRQARDDGSVGAISAVDKLAAEAAGAADEDIFIQPAVQDGATNYYIFDDQYVPSHVYKV